MAMTREERRGARLFPSKDLDVETALELLEWSWYRFARSTEALDDARIAAVLQALPAWVSSKTARGSDEGRRRAAAVFLQSAVDEASGERLRETWRAAVNALKAFESQYAWGSKEKAARLTAIRGDSRLVEASRAAAVASMQVPLELLAVLALEGSEASADALMPHVERALSNALWLEHLEQLQRFAAKTAPMRSLFGVVSQQLAAARASSPVTDLAQGLGIASGARFRVELRVPGTDGASLLLELDSKRPGPAFTGWVSASGRAGTYTMLHREDGTTECSLLELPAWLRRRAEALGTTWQFEKATVSHLRGKRLETFLAWLSGALRSPT